MKKRYIFLLLGLFKLPLIFVLVILLIVPSNLSSTSNHNCPNGGTTSISTGYPFAEDFTVTQTFGGDSFGLYGGVGHTGIDLVPVVGRNFEEEDVKVYSIADGKVISASTLVGGHQAGDNYVHVQMEGGKRYWYSHLKKHSVKTGDEIKKGQEVGVMGNTGYSTGHHLHIQVWGQNGVLEDPSPYLGVDSATTGHVFKVNGGGIKENSKKESKNTEVKDKEQNKEVEKDKTEDNTEKGTTEELDKGVEGEIDLEEISSCSEGEYDGELEGNDNVEKAWFFFKNKGFSDEATAGILGNAMQESRLEPDTVEAGNGIGFGIFQWSFTRRTDLENWAKQNNLDVKSLSTQLNFTMVELEKMSFTENYKKIKDVYEATDQFEREYERAGIKMMANRYKFAEEIYKKFKGKKSSGKAGKNFKGKIKNRGARFNSAKDRALYNRVADNYKTDPTVKGLNPRVAKMKQFLGAKFGIKSFSLYRPGDNDGTGHGHGNGLAIDLMVPVGSDLGDEIAKYLTDNYDDLGVYYIIWEQKFYMNQNNIYGPANTWNMMPDRGSVTANHYDHVHISFKS